MIQPSNYLDLLPISSYPSVHSSSPKLTSHFQNEATQKGAEGSLWLSFFIYKMRMGMAPAL